MSSNDSADYFDLHLNGIGYLNKVREVAAEGGNSFWSANITAIHGHIDHVQHTHFDCIVSGEEAKDLVRQLQPAVEAEQKVLVGFQLSGLSAQPFTFKKGKRAGETGVGLKSRLLRFQWIKVDGQQYLAPRSAAG